MLSSALETSFTQAQQLQAQGDITEAFMLYQHIFREEPNHIPTLEALIELALGLQNFDAADKIIRHLLHLDPGQPTYWGWLLAAGNTSAKEKKQARSLSNIPSRDLIPLRVLACKKLLEEHNTAAAEALMEQIASLAPDHQDLAGMEQQITQLQTRH